VRVSWGELLTGVVPGALADAFMQVGVFVAVLVALVGWARWRHGDRVGDVLERHGRWAPLIGAVLGVSPGCAGAILVMPLFARGSVSFGTVVAALVATMGDSSWVVIAHDPAFALRIHCLLFVTGMCTGYAVDALGLRPRGAAVPVAVPVPAPVPMPAATVLRAPLGPAPAAFWGLSGVGSLVAVPVAFQLVDDPVLTALAGGVDPYVLLGVAGTLAALAVVLHARRHPRVAGADTSLRGILWEGARETSTVVVGVAVAYLIWGVLRAVTGFDGTQLALGGVAGVLIGACIGLIPGCAVQIAFTSLYLAGAMPLPTLVANALSQDGDALLPLIPLDRRGALLATVVTTVPGLLVGGAFLLAG
jgi:hypothetical protein